MKRIFILLGFICCGLLAIAQSSPFQIALEPLEIKGMPGMQSFAFGQHGDEWLLVGGRVDGMHRRQPFAAFDSAGHNYQLVVVSPTRSMVWTAGMGDLPISIQEQLSATNPEFFQDGNTLYVIGGYGYSPSLGDHKTYEFLTAIDITGAIQAIQTGGKLAPYFRQISDPKFAVAGGQLAKIQDTFYLIGGHNFGGRYNPMGPDRGPGFVQHYNHYPRTFQIDEKATALEVTFGESVADSVLLHRRDYNLLPQILPDGRQGLMAYSGVFQYKADIPYLNCLLFDERGYAPVAGFQQHYQQYHCAKLPLFSKATREMHALFLGGISEYYDSAGMHVLDCNVPFVKTIARVTRDASGQMREYKLPVEMPAYLGASAEFIPIAALPQYPNGVIKLDDLPAEKTLIGYVVGGIHSSDDNIFWVNEGEHSSASTQLFKVFLSKSPTAPADFEQLQSTSPLQLEVIPDPFKAILFVDFLNPTVGDVNLVFTNAKGKDILKKTYSAMGSGAQHLALECKQLKKGGRFFLTVTTPAASLHLKVVVEL